MKLDKFFEKYLVDGRIDGTFTTSKPIEQIQQLRQERRIHFEITLQKDGDRVTFIVPKHRKELGKGILHNTLVQTEITLDNIFLRWIPAYQPTFEGFNVKLTPLSDNSGTFILHLTNPHRFLFWKEQLGLPNSMRENL